MVRMVLIGCKNFGYYLWLSAKIAKGQKKILDSGVERRGVLERD